MNLELPLTIFVDTRSYFKVLDRLYLLLTSNSSSSLTTSIRAGTLPYLGTETIGAAYTSYEPGIGRNRTQETIQTPVARERHLRSELYASLNPLHQQQGFDANSLITRDFECISLSFAPQWLQLKILEDATILGSTLLIARFDPSDPLQFCFLWQRFVLRGLALEGNLLKPLEEDPADLGVDSSGRMYLVPPNSAGENPHGNGWFHVLGDQDLPAVERRFIQADLPRVIDPPATRKSPAFARTPARNALQYLEQTTTRRPSARDEADKPGHTTSPPPALQFPDPEKVISKVQFYCLAPERPENKWLGFAKAGYESRRPGDAFLLTNSICSVLFQAFHAYDVRTTADGTTQFTVDILLPSRRGGYVTVASSWHFGENKDVGLSTAFVTNGLTLCNKTQSLHEASFSHPATLWKEVWERAYPYGELVRGDEGQTMGWLWILVDEASADFVAYVRGAGHAGIVRQINGKRYVQALGPGPAVLGETQMHGTLRQAQVLLGIAGIQSRVEVRLH